MIILLTIDSVRHLFSYNYSLRRAKYFLYSPSVSFTHKNRLKKDVLAVYQLSFVGSQDYVFNCFSYAFGYNRNNVILIYNYMRHFPQLLGYLRSHYIGG